MNNLKRVLPYMKPHRTAIIVSLICMLLSGVLSGAFLFLAQRVLEPMLESGGDPAERLRKLNFFTLVVLGVSVTRMLVDFGQVYVTQRTGQRILAKLRLDLFSHFQKLSVGYFERRRTGEIMSRTTNDLGALQNIMTLSVATAISAPIQFVIAVTYMFSVNWRLALLSFLILPPVVFMINRAGRRIREATTKLQVQTGELFEYLQEKIAAMRLIQTFGTKNLEIARFTEQNDLTYKSTMKPLRIQASLAPVIEFTGMMGVMITLWYGARSVVAGDMKSAALITYLFAVHRAAMCAKSLAGLNLNFKQAEASAMRLFEIIDTEPEIQDAPGAKPLKRSEVEGHLVFENVDFAYHGGETVLHDISFEIKPGEVVALAGLSGSGKTTISALVPRLYDPVKGRVLVDGHDLRDVTVESLRANIGAVPQETTLFHGTVSSNIAYGRPDATEAEIHEAARRANAEEFIVTLPQGYDTPIGERGNRLSGGQRQRLAIARALLRDPRILILDEATSALDSQSEAKVQEALARLMEGRTTLVIAHRFSTIQNANRILVMDQGHIIESGTHDELLAKGGRYHRLYHTQMQSDAPSETEELEVAAESDAVEIGTTNGSLPVANSTVGSKPATGLSY